MSQDGKGGIPQRLCSLRNLNLLLKQGASRFTKVAFYEEQVLHDDRGLYVGLLLGNDQPAALLVAAAAAAALFGGGDGQGSGASGVCAVGDGG
jgi:hypothetical protein